MNSALAQVARLIGVLVLCALALQLYFLARIALMLVVDPQSTTFQRSEMWRLLVQHGRIEWTQQWAGYDRLGANLKRAVIASEDSSFFEHSGVEWEAIEKAWERNQLAEARAERQNGKAAAPRAEPKIVGGSTITQQLAKNLFLGSERSLLRKGQEIVITYMLEALLNKQRILAIYLNSVEWGEGIFGAQAASKYYFRVDAAQLSAQQAARLAVMLPAPKRFEKRPGSAYVVGRAGTIAARMGAVELP